MEEERIPEKLSEGVSTISLTGHEKKVYLQAMHDKFRQIYLGKLRSTLADCHFMFHPWPVHVYVENRYSSIQKQA